MAVISLITAGKVNPVSGVANGHEQRDFEADEQITAGQAFRISTTTGKATKANASVVAEAGQSVAGTYNAELWVCIASARQAGNTVTGIRKGELDGFNLDALAYGAPVFLNDADGSIGDAAGTISTQIGRVRPVSLTGTPSGADKVLAVRCPPLT